MRRLVTCLAIGVCVVASCTTTTDSTTTTTATESTTTTTTMATSTTTTSTPATTTTEPSTTTTTTQDTSSTTTTTDPGTPVDGPVPGSAWGVVGVRHDDTLNVRSAPGIAASIVGTLEPTAVDVIATGDAVMIRTTIWWEVETSTADGWVASSYLAAHGSTDDVTAAVVAANDGVWLSAVTMELLAVEVAQLRGADRIVVVVAASDDGTHGEITIDAFMDFDDSIRGERLLIAGQTDDSTPGFGLHIVESTWLCWRGADPDGLCV